jgi:hypothetical protein
MQFFAQKCQHNWLKHREGKLDINYASRSPTNSPYSLVSKNMKELKNMQFLLISASTEGKLYFDNKSLFSCRLHINYASRSPTNSPYSLVSKNLKELKNMQFLLKSASTERKLDINYASK